MKIIKTTEGWELIPQDSEEEARLAWWIEAMKSHPDQRTEETGSCVERSPLG